jgi:AraC family transcriptional regulator of adaptative response / DNA-3-methyladenine glycosylase II
MSVSRARLERRYAGELDPSELPAARDPRGREATASGLPGARAAARPWAGGFVVGVLSTGIYCLPSCRARKPRPEHVRYFATPADARAAGLRACLRCRPDESFGGGHPERDRFEALLAELRRDPAAFAAPAALAARAGLGATRLHRGFREHFHTTPAAALLAARLARAEELLARGEGVADAAFRAGFSTLSTFHDRFLGATGLTPGAFRELGRTPDFVLALPAGFLPGPTLRSWGRDPSSLTERVDGNRILRTLRTTAGAALLEIEIAAGAARCRVEAERPLDLGTVRAAHRIARRTLGLVDGLGGAAPVAACERRLLRDAATARLVAQRRGLRIPLTADAFEALTWAVLGQQVNLAFAFTLRRHLLALAGAPAPRGLRAHPTPAEVAALDPADLVRRQLSRRKAEYLVELARAVAAGELPLDELGLAAASRVEESLLARRGVGPWTAAYVMLRGYGLADCVPVGDAGLALALERFHALAERPDAAATRRLMAPFAPYRSFATFHFWSSLGDVQ